MSLLSMEWNLSRKEQHMTTLPHPSERGSPRIVDTGSALALLGEVWIPLVWGVSLGLLLGVVLGIFGLVLGIATAFWACFWRVPENHNAVLTAFGAYRNVLRGGWNFAGPWPLYRLDRSALVPLAPIPFAVRPRDVDTFEGAGEHGGQITVDITGTYRVVYPRLFLIAGGGAVVTRQVMSAIESVVRQYCALRTFDELKYEKGTGSAAAVFRGDVEWFTYWELSEDGNWVESPLPTWVSVSGYTLRAYLKYLYGVEIYSLEVQDFTPSNEALRQAQDLAAVAAEEKRKAQIVIDAIRNGATALREGIPGLDPGTAARIAAGANRAGDLKLIDLGGGGSGGTQPRVLINPN